MKWPEGSEMCVACAEACLCPGCMVSSLHRLNRVTGKVERIMIGGRSVRVVLPGGTGDLLKIDDGTFPDL